MTLDCSKPVKWVIARTSLIQQWWYSLTLSLGGSFRLGIFELQHADPSCLSFALYTKCTLLSLYFWNVKCPWIFRCYLSWLLSWWFSLFIYSVPDFFGLSMHIQSPLFTSLLSCLLLDCASARTLFCLSNFTIKVVDFFDKFSLDKPSVYTNDVPVGFDLIHALTKKFQW